MAATRNLPHSLAVSQIPRHGVLILHGFGIKVRLDCGHLCAEWGVGSKRYQVRLSRVEGRKLRRVVAIGSDGYCSLEALRFISDVGAAFLMLDRRGKAIAICGPSAPSDARLRRAQALALGNGTALRISKELIRQKLEGQAALVRDMLQNAVAANSIQRFKAELSSAESIESVRLTEAQAAKLYWQVWSDVAIRWTGKDERRVPEHWKRFGSRISPLTHSPRLSATPACAVLNLLYTLTESEARLAAAAMGLDPAIGLLHVDTANRDSLACDLQELVRTSVDAFLLNWLQSEPFRKSDFWEDRNGNCRICTSLAIELCETADTWCKLVSPVAEWVGQELWASRATKGQRMLLATRLTQRNRRLAKDSEVPAVNHPRPEHVCKGCGVEIRSDKTLCLKCWKKATRVNFATGRKMAHSPDSLARRAETQRQQRALNRAFDLASLPAWLTREYMMSRVIPALAHIPKAFIRARLGVSEPHAMRISHGLVPHPRHWTKLVELAGVCR